VRLSLSRRWALLVVAAAIADTVVVATAEPFTWRAGVGTAIGIAGVVAAGIVSARRTGGSATVAAGKDSVLRPGVYAWAGLAAAIALFELLNFLLLPRHDHPTISSLLGVLTAGGVGRAALFACWLLAGWWWVAPS
jgi:hypothetical protein